MVAKETIDLAMQDYANGMSTVSVAKRYNIGAATVWRYAKKMGISRTSLEASHLARDNGRLGSGFRGKKRIMTPEHLANLKAARVEWGLKKSDGKRINKAGYIEYIRGPNKGRCEHVVLVEGVIGRRIARNECVHHIDGNKTNNDLSNLQLMTISEHSALHRRLEAEMGKIRERDEYGRFC